MANANDLAAVAGQDHGSGEFFTPGEHIVRVEKVDYFDSKADGTPTYLVTGTVLESHGGSHKFEMSGGLAQDCTPRAAAPMRVGSPFTWVQTKDKQVFVTRVGNFNIAAKRAILQEAKGVAPELIEANIKQSWGAPDDQVRVRKFYAEGPKNPETTVGNEAVDILQLGLANGVMLKVVCVETPVRNKSRIITDTTWKCPTPEDVARVEAALAANNDE